MDVTENTGTDPRRGAFFTRGDWIAAAVGLVAALAVYTLTLAPTVTLEDSGELVTASDYLGVPHPPGYPSWSLLTWLFQWVFHFVRFHGHPNPAWAVNFFSAFAGALACGVIAMLVSCSGRHILQHLQKQSRALGERTCSVFCMVAGISAGLLLAFSQGMWSQAVIAEVYTLNVLFQSLVLIFLYRWMCRPSDYRYLFVMAFVFGLGLTNHQTLIFMGVALAFAVFCKDLRFRPPRDLILGICAAAAVAAVIWASKADVQPLIWIGLLGAFVLAGMLRQMILFRDFLLTGLCFVLMYALNMIAANYGEASMLWTSGPGSWGFWFWTAYSLIIPVIAAFVLPNGRAVCFTFLLAFLGLSFYLYMPLSSDQNPPINWGYPRTWQGFMHAITRGQYEKVTMSDVFSKQFLLQIRAYLHDLRSQFFAPVALLALIPFLALPVFRRDDGTWKVYSRFGRTGAFWLLTSAVAFIAVGIMFIILQNPKLDIQTLFIARVQYIQSHAIYAIWLGYGLLLLMAFLQTLVHNRPLFRYTGLALVLLLPFSLIWKNYYSEKQFSVVGGCEQNGHHFGWQFGNWSLRGWKGIRDDLNAELPEEEFRRVWEDYPTPGYPEPMGTNAIFFGGTDPGRFVPTYMIYCAKVRPDVYLITQNALADHTYMAVMRDLYGDQIWIPSPKDTNLAFQEYIRAVREGKMQSGGDLQVQGGRVSIEGVGGVMKVNGILTRDIFEHNPYVTEAKTHEKTRPVGSAVVPHEPRIDPETGHPPKRTFYVEESYVIPWMYPYLTPNGIIMKLNQEPTELTPEMVHNDMVFWDWYEDRLLSDPKFKRDVVARKSFSKLRGSIGGLYHARGMDEEAERVFRQSIRLYPLSPEAVFRLADLYQSQDRYGDAKQVVSELLEQDRLNDKARSFLEHLDRMQQLETRRRELRKRLEAGKSLDLLELIRIEQALGHTGEVVRLTRLALSEDRLSPEQTGQLAGALIRIKRYDLAEEVVTDYLKKQPGNVAVWLDLASLRMQLRRPLNAVLEPLRSAVQAGGDLAREKIRRDERFKALRKHPSFRAIVGNPSPSLNRKRMSPSFP
ncbi:DUF2723 domain-containing protein [Kiritimatiella glycovorans]|uniref:Putative PEP-CTERM system TPR-repeat lipoprotein n=1 Tax=Kiritimatiella glycovorans TaxID=1307763 RepID=A0A0G3ECY8_9BACT|nr:DUF2723 domain-containing protein [Kiritimatiella glycovorans]AKJ64316.1 putative PEP-CTERM system TPR-repeat lipoprotein [Kiritimatiella glycovorans]